MKPLPTIAAASLAAILTHDSLADRPSVPDGLSPASWSSLREAYHAARHAIRTRGDGTHLARNPGQQWLAEFDGTGFLVRPDHGAWTWGMDLRAVGERSLCHRPQITVQGNKLVYRWAAGLEEWFLNDQRGLEQGWTVVTANATDDSLTLEFNIRGPLAPRISDDKLSVAFRNRDGAAALTYGGLKAWDAQDRVLPVRFAPGQTDGTLCIVVDTGGAVFPVTIDPLVQQAYLKASNTDGEDWFGRAVAVSSNTVVVGAPREDSLATGVNGSQGNPPPHELGELSGSGAAYVFVRNGFSWTQQAYLKASNTEHPQEMDYFGQSVAISGDTVVVGAWQESSAATGVNGNERDNSAPHAGAAYVFVRNGTTWTQEAYLKASNTGIGDIFGWSVAVSGDTVVVGAPLEGSDATGVNGSQGDAPSLEPPKPYIAGAAYVFVRERTMWTQQAYLKASNTGYRDGFGISVAVSGDAVVVGAFREDSAATEVDGDGADDSAEEAGAAYVFVRNGETWSQQAYLKASNSGLGDWFGLSVGISGDRIVVGARGEGSSATGVGGDSSDNSMGGSGAAYVFVRNGATWTEEAYLKASNTGKEDKFGYAVAIDGDRVVVGAWDEDSNATGVDGDGTNDFAVQSGAAYVFARSESIGWFHRAYLKRSVSDFGGADRFGMAVAVSGSTVVVGAEGEDSASLGVNQDATNNNAPHQAGAAYVFWNFPDFEGEGPYLVLEKPKLIYWTPEFPFLFFGPLLGDETALERLEIRNTTTALLTGLAVEITGAGAEAFRLTSAPADTMRGGETIAFTLEFVPSAAGEHLAMLNVTGFEEDGSVFTKTLALSGTVLSRTADTDLDGMNDEAEHLLRDLGFDWQTAQPSLVESYYAHASNAGLFSSDQVQALHGPAAVLSRDPGSGLFVLTMDWQHSTDLKNFFDFPLTDEDVSVNAEGDIQFTFDSEADAMFFRVDWE